MRGEKPNISHHRHLSKFLLLPDLGLFGRPGSRILLKYLAFELHRLSDRLGFERSTFMRKKEKKFWAIIVQPSSSYPRETLLRHGSGISSSRPDMVVINRLNSWSNKQSNRFSGRLAYKIKLLLKLEVLGYSAAFLPIPERHHYDVDPRRAVRGQTW